MRRQPHCTDALSDQATARGSVLAAGLWLAEAVLLSMRARKEERLLDASDPGYAPYKARVPYRFMPFVV